MFKIWPTVDERSLHDICIWYAIEFPHVCQSGLFVLNVSEMVKCTTID